MLNCFCEQRGNCLGETLASPFVLCCRKFWRELFNLAYIHSAKDFSPESFNGSKCAEGCMAVKWVIHICMLGMRGDQIRKSTLKSLCFENLPKKSMLLVLKIVCWIRCLFCVSFSWNNWLSVEQVSCFQCGNFWRSFWLRKCVTPLIAVQWNSLGCQLV